MEEGKIRPLFEVQNSWRFKDFTVGVHVATQNMGYEREYYLLLSLFCWQISIGFSVRNKRYSEGID